MLAALGDAEW